MVKWTRKRTLEVLCFTLMLASGLLRGCEGFEVNYTYVIWGYVLLETGFFV